MGTIGAVEFGDDLLQRFLADHRIDHLFDDAVRLSYRGLGKFEEQLRLAAHLLELRKVALGDLLFGARAQVMGDLQQQVKQQIGELLARAPAEHRHHAVANDRRMPTQLADRFGVTARSKLLDEFGGSVFKHLRRQGEPIDALQFGDAQQQALKARFAEVGRGPCIQWTSVDASGAPLPR